MEKKIVSGIMLTLLLISILTLAFDIKAVKAEDTAMISVYPSTSTGLVGENFTVDITVTDAVDIQLWEANITFDPTVLEVVDAAEGEFLKRGGYPTLFDYAVRGGGSAVYFGCTYYFVVGPGNGVDGSGILGNVTFRVIDDGATPMHFGEDYTSLWYNNGTDLVAQPLIRHDGFFTNLHDVAVTSVTAFPTSVNAGESVSINVTVVNQGDFDETFGVTIFYSLFPFPELTDIETKAGEILEAGRTKTLEFTWNTTSERSGIYNITAVASIVTNEFNTKDNELTNSTVTIRGAPVAFFTYTPEGPTIIDTVTFDTSESYDPDDPDGIVSYEWDFDDGAYAYGKIVNHTYTVARNYDVSVTVTDKETLTDTYTETLTISEPQPPIAWFTCTTEDPFTNRPVAFNASESYDPDGDIVSYKWDFGDGSDPEFYDAPQGVIVTHNYKDASTYTVNLTVTDNHGAIDSSTLDVIVSRYTCISLPYHRQIKSYYCGPAALEMLFDFYGPDIPQREIADVARTAPDGTYTVDMVRATHFSDLSTSVGREMSGNITGYTARKLGYAAFEYWGMTIEELKSLITAGYPIITLTTWHYRVAVGYDSTHITFQDSYYGKMFNMTYERFDVDWDYSDHWGLFVSPWEIEVAIPLNVSLGSVFNVTATVTYPLYPPFPTGQYPTSVANATVTLPAGLTLVSGEVSKKTIGTGDLAAGSSANVTWIVRADSLGIYAISVEAEGKVKGSVPPLPSYPDFYSYRDRIGGFATSNTTVIPAMIPPRMSADLIRRGAWPEHHRFVLSKDGDPLVDDKHGTPGYQTLYGMVKNTGNVTIPTGTYKIAWNVSDSTGSSRIWETVGTLSLAPMDIAVLAYNVSAIDLTAGKYCVEARCYYYSLEGKKAETFFFTVVS